MSNTIRTIAWQAVAASIVLMSCLGGVAEAQQPKLGSSPKYIPPLGASARAPSVPLAAPFPLGQTFLLHSRATATKVIYLDFDGHVITGTGWNTANNAWPTNTPTITSNIWSIEGGTAFSNNELTIIQETWQRVSECFSPFDVDVTTEPPALVDDLIDTGGGDTKWGVRVCIGTTTPSSPGGGWGFIGGFGTNAGTGNDTPCFVFNLSSAKVIADTSVHEAGHTLGLNHDGLLTPVTTYYFGHGTGPTGWAPHMGAAYNRNLAQFSKGEYNSANNFEDDLSKITTQNGFGYRADDAGNTQATAGSIAGAIAAGTFNIGQSGVIERNTDEDWYMIVCEAGNLTLNAVGGPANTSLDIRMDLYNSGGILQTSDNPFDDVTASISRTVTAGTYFVRIDGVGKGNPLGTGYTDYGSIGQYQITGTYVTVPAPPPGPAQTTVAYNSGTRTLTITGDALRADQFTVTQSRGVLKVTAGRNCRVNGGTTASFNISSPDLPIALVCDLMGGGDSMSLTGLKLSTANVLLGNGNDYLSLSYCTIDALTLDGGTGTDAFFYPGTKFIQPRVVTNVP